jgi:hypothetical protein
MFTDVQLKSALHVAGLSRKEEALLCLAVDPMKPRAVAEIRGIAVRAGVKGAKGWNIADTLGSLRGLAIRTDRGWELTAAGQAEAARLGGVNQPPAPVSTLRKLLPKISSPDVVTFIEEALGSIEAHHYRAAVVLTWVGAVAILYDYVVVNHLAAFNAEAQRRDAKWKSAKTADDLARMKEHDFLQVLESLSVIGKNVKTELEACLKLRNACGHPNSLKVAEHRVNSHVETLVLNVYAEFI